MSCRTTIDAAVVIDFWNKRWDIHSDIGTNIVEAMPSFVNNLPPSTPILFYHCEANRDFVYKHFEDEIVRGKIRPIQIKASKASERTFIWQYSKFLTNLDFWESLPGENLLMFQSDTCLCGTSVYKLEQLTNYDYVAATWPEDVYTERHTDLFNGELLGGNGGLSFRKKSAMVNLLKNKHLHSFPCPADVVGQPINEDMWFCSHPMFKDLKLPTVEESKQFFNEFVVTDTPLGVHNIWRYNDSSTMEHLARNCPDLLNLTELIRHHMWVRLRQFYNP